MPIASVTLAPQAASSLARIAGSPPPGSPATITRLTLDFARSLPRAAAHSARCRAYEGVIATTVGFEQLDCGDEALGVSRADGNMAEAEPVEGAKRRPGDEGPGVIGRDDALAAR